MKERRKQKKRLDWRPPLNKLLDPICDPVPKEFRERWKEEANELYYSAENSEYRRYKNCEYRKFVCKMLLMLIGYITFGAKYLLFFILVELIHMI